MKKILFVFQIFIFTFLIIGCNTSMKSENDNHTNFTLQYIEKKILSNATSYNLPIATEKDARLFVQEWLNNHTSYSEDCTPCNL